MTALNEVLPTNGWPCGSEEMPDGERLSRGVERPQPHEMLRILKKGLSTKKRRSKGQTRATTHFAGEGGLAVAREASSRALFRSRRSPRLLVVSVRARAV
jgi:hypothetical protein